MTTPDFLDLLHKLDDKRIDVMEKKRHDYATEDALSNFKRMATICSTLKVDVKTPFGAAMFLMLLKIDRWNNLVSSCKSPKNESVEDTVMDLHNYIDLAHAIYVETKAADDKLDGVCRKNK